MPSATQSLLAGNNKETLKIMAWTKLKIAALAGVGIFLAAGTAIIAIKLARTHHATTNDANGSDSVADRIWELYSKACECECECLRVSVLNGA